VAHLCSHLPARKRALLEDNNTELADALYARLADLVKRNQFDGRSEGLVVLADLTGPATPVGEENKADEAVHREAFKRFDPSSATSLIMSYAQMPFEEVAVNSYHVLSRLANQGWGLQEIRDEVRQAPCSGHY